MLQTLNINGGGYGHRLELGVESGGRSSTVCAPAFAFGSTCSRCGGLMVGEFCMDLLNGVGELEFLASRCVQGGEVVDPVIQKNRRIHRPSPTEHVLDPEAPTHHESIQRRA